MLGSGPKTGRDLVSIDDLSNEEIVGVFAAADEIARDLKAWSHLCPGFILASLFHEPSTRTRLSFESAMLRLGGGVVTIADAKSSSAAKGESLADTVRIISGRYADLIVLRDPRDGAARLAADYSSVPVVNAGDGSHQHPTQTLCDLYSLRRAKGELSGLDVVLCGDLKYSRTVHSLAYALARFGAKIVLVAPAGLEMPGYCLRRLREEYGSEPRTASLEEFHRPGPPVDVLYVTRPQTERLAGGERPRRDYLRIDRKFLAADRFRGAVVMHPLPRTHELAPELDADPRSLYFQQASLGIPVRMAVIGSLLGKFPWRGDPPTLRRGAPAVADGARCPNSNCISRSEGDYASPRFRSHPGEVPRLGCEYCEEEVPVTPSHSKD